MPEWTDKHDAHIARECEGLKAIPEKGMPERLWKWNRTGKRTADGMSPICLPSYATDAKARDRAAEAWRKQEQGREYMVHSAITWGKMSKPARAVVMGFTALAVEAEGEHALLWALYRATGGKE